ncbi:MAG: DUF3179 domain-containing (seleno)protein [Thermoguttaceae bacterium]|jgi:hypothetical protein
MRRRWSRKKKALVIALSGLAVAGLLYLWLPYRVAMLQLFFRLGGSRVMIPAEYAALDSPGYISIAQADEYPPDAEVLGLELNGEARAIPVKRIDWHLVVNDCIGGEAVVITHCTMTEAALAYRAGSGNQGLHFAPARLARNNLVMRDLETGSSWQQFTGVATDGPMAGTQLERIPLWRGRLEDWRQRYPVGVILKPSRSDHDCCAPNDTCPVMSYFPSKPFLLQRPTHDDDRLPRKERVVGTCSTGGQPVAVSQGQPEDQADRQRGLQVACYWFAWAEFHPDTNLASAWDQIMTDHAKLDGATSGRE